jgi:hypothetical protein
LRRIDSIEWGATSATPGRDRSGLRADRLGPRRTTCLRASADRLARRGASAARAVSEWPAHFVASDLLRLSGTDTTVWPYRRRRAALESVFAGRRLSTPWAPCPSTTEAEGLSIERCNWGGGGY